MYSQAAQAYQKASKAASNPRELEASLLMKAAARLQTLIDNWEPDQESLDDALTYNRRLWTVLVTSATKLDNPLPEPIKQNMANLGLYVFKTSIGALAEPRPDKLKSLVSINRNIAEGLRGRAA